MFLTEYDEKQHMKHTFEEGRASGMEEGQEQILFLTQILVTNNRLEDLKKASSDKEYLKKLLKEFGL